MGLPGLNIHCVDRDWAHSSCFWGCTAGSGHAVGAEWMFLVKAAVARLFKRSRDRQELVLVKIPPKGRCKRQLSVLLRTALPF